MTITLAFFLAYIPLGIFVCDISSNFLREEIQEKVSILDPNFFQKDSTELPIPTLTKQGNYKSLKYSIRSKQAKLQEAYKHANDSTAKAKIINKAAFYITEQLINYLIPHWYGTPWAFDGYTAVPN
ncbi:hypothetical protein [Aureispira anguillae]|uniref:Uncharacterized protein n=1 Tax=Aureispira anguillae TaxID=2864201 RepID=A0A916DU89_9BACT|nr:hypothetical protein [Aureispira anguillae]BDS13131.1 hypothetical protein AsAng_0038590 [Aureispira anguillae]